MPTNHRADREGNTKNGRIAMIRIVGNIVDAGTGEILERFDREARIFLDHADGQFLYRGGTKIMFSLSEEEAKKRGVAR